MTIKEIREDLKEIRYYYEKAELFKAGSKYVPPKYILEKVEKYSRAVANAPAQLYAVYVGLYINNNTQLVLAEDWGYSTDFVKKLNHNLCNFIKKEFEKEEKEG